MHIFSRFFHRFQAPLPLHKCIKSGIKGMLAIMILAGLTDYSHISLIMAPFGASCILIFTNPKDPFSQPINIVGGYVIASMIGVIFALYIPHEWWAAGASVGFTIFFMALFRVTHPPAGAVPLVMYYYHHALDFNFILFPGLLGSLSLLVVAVLFHHLPFAKREYPRRLD